MPEIKTESERSSNTSIYYKLRQSYLIIDIEPKADDSKSQNDQLSSSFLVDVISSSKKNDRSLSNILQIIGALAVIIIVILVIIKQICRCRKTCQSNTNKEDQVNKSSLLHSVSSNVVQRKVHLRQ